MKLPHYTSHPLLLTFLNAMEISMYYWYTSNEHLPLSMPLPFLSFQGFWELSIAHTQILLESMCFAWYVVGIDISVDEEGESKQFKGFNSRCSFECIVVTPLLWSEFEFNWTPIQLEWMGIFIAINNCTCTCYMLLYYNLILLSDFPIQTWIHKRTHKQKHLHIRISTNISLCTLC